MNRLTFWRILSSLSLVLSACAESAIPADEDPGDDGDVDSQMGENNDLDASVNADSAAPRDGSTRPDAARDPVSDAGDAGARDAGGGLDAGSDASSDAGRDAAVDTGVPDSGGPISCSNGQTTCGNACVNTTNDVNNCGGCGMKCASGQTCSSSQCMGGVPDFNVPSGCTKKTLGQHGYAFCTNTRSWRDARSACLDSNLDLAIITDKAEGDFVRTNGDSWIAVNDRTSEGRYQQVVPGNRDRVDGANASYTNWRSGEPNNNETCDGFSIPVIGCFGQRTDEDCGMIYADGTWNDGACEERRNFVCESY